MKVQGPDQLVGHRALDTNGRRVGVIRRVLCADGDPYTAQWAIVTLGPWRARPRLIPLAAAAHHERGIQLPYPRDTIRMSPRVRMRCADEIALHAARMFYERQR